MKNINRKQFIQNFVKMRKGMRISYPILREFMVESYLLNLPTFVSKETVEITRLKMHKGIDEGLS